MGPLFVFFAAMMLSAFLFWLSHLAWHGILSDLGTIKRQQKHDELERSEIRKAIIVLCDDIILVLQETTIDTNRQEKKVQKIIDRLNKFDPERESEMKDNLEKGHQL